MAERAPVGVLLADAAAGEEAAWREIVARYASLVATVCHRHGVTGSDADDVAGNVWLRLVTGLGAIREPKALPKWLMTTTRRECLVLLRERGRHVPHDDVDTVVAPEELSLLRTERVDAVRDAVACLPARDRELLTLLFADPPIPYRKISATLGMPVGAIGPTRQRCLARVRRVPSIAALLGDRHAGAR